MIGYALVNHLMIKYGKLILDYLLSKVGTKESRDCVSNDQIIVLYLRFLQMILKNVVDNDTREAFEGEIIESSIMCVHLFSNLETRNKYPDEAVVLTPYMRPFILGIGPQPQLEAAGPSNA